MYGTIKLYPPNKLRVVPDNNIIGFDGKYPLIYYALDKCKISQSASWYIENIGTGGSVYDATMYGSDAVYLNGVDQYVELPIIHDISITDTKQTATLGAGWVDNGADSYTATSATSALSALTSSATNNVQITFTISNYSAGDVEGFSANGTYTVDVNDASLDATAFSGDVLIVSVYEITIPTNSYMTYFDVNAKEFEQIANADNRDLSSKELLYNGDFSLGDVNINKATGIDYTIINNSLYVSSTANWVRVWMDTNVKGDTDLLLSTKYDVDISQLATGEEADVESGFNQSRTNPFNRFYPVSATGIYEKHEYHTPYGADTVDIGFALNLVNGGTLIINSVSLKQVLPISTTYKMKKSFQMCFTHNTPLSQEDLDAINNNPNLLFDVWFNGASLPSSFNRSNMVDFVPANEGKITHGQFLQNLRYELGLELVVNWNTHTDNSAWSVGTITNEPDGVTKLDYGTFTNSYFYLRGLNSEFSADLEIGKTYLITVEYKSDSTSSFPLIPYGASSYGTEGYIAGSGFKKYVQVFTATNTTSTYLRAYCDADPRVIYWKNLSVREVTNLLEIQNYTTACRDTYHNIEFGATNFLLQQDASGRPAGVMPIGKIAGSDDGRYIEVPPSLTQYPITVCTKEISGDDDTALTIMQC